MTQPPILIAPSLLSCDFARIGAEVAEVEGGGADWLHVDVMDGHFVPNLTLGPPVVKSIHAAAKVPLDVHLMITDPAQYAEAFVRAGAHALTFHTEVVDGDAEAREVIAKMRGLGVKVVGMALNPETPVKRIAGLVDELDLVLVMSVHPGFGGQAFIPDVLDKVRWLRERGYQGHVEMDGGLDANTIPSCAEAGANVLVSGSALFGQTDRPATIAAFRAAALEAQSGALK